jgi:hypothetical protein
MSCVGVFYDEKNYALLMWSHASHQPPSHLNCDAKATLPPPYEKNITHITTLCAAAAIKTTTGNNAMI